MKVHVVSTFKARDQEAAHAIEKSAADAEGTLVIKEGDEAFDAMDGLIWIIRRRRQ